MIHISEAEAPLKEGETVSAVVIQVDGENQKLALSTREHNFDNEKDKVKEKSKDKDPIDKGMEKSTGEEKKEKEKKKSKDTKSTKK